MFERFIKNKTCVDTIMWLLNHSTGDYDAAIIAADIGVEDIGRFTTVLFILDELDIINTNQDTNEYNLRVIFNEESVIVQSFRTLIECFDNEAYRNSNVCGALSDYINIDSGIDINSEVEFIELLKSMPVEYVDTFLDMFEHYDEIEFDNNPVLAERQKIIKEEAKRLDDAGQLESFIEFCNQNRK